MEYYADYFGMNAAELQNKKLFLLDMDGTIYNEEQLFDGVLEFLAEIKANNGHYVFITNNSSKSVTAYIEKVNRMGIPADIDNFFTSVQATVRLFQQKLENPKVYCQGTKSMIEELRAAGINVTEEMDEDIDVILVGFDTELTSAKLRRTCELLLRDIPFYAANPDLVCPVSFGYIPDCGSICMMLENATGRKPIYIGKPEPTMIDIVREKFGASKEETVVVGDRLYTDIAAGLNAGVTSVCVLTGEATVEDIKSSPFRPTYTLESVNDILRILRS